MKDWLFHGRALTDSPHAVARRWKFFSLRFRRPQFCFSAIRSAYWSDRNSLARLCLRGFDSSDSGRTIGVSGDTRLIHSAPPLGARAQAPWLISSQVNHSACFPANSFGAYRCAGVVQEVTTRGKDIIADLQAARKPPLAPTATICGCQRQLGFRPRRSIRREAEPLHARHGSQTDRW